MVSGERNRLSIHCQEEPAIGDPRHQMGGDRTAHREAVDVRPLEADVSSASACAIPLSRQVCA